MKVDTAQRAGITVVTVSQLTISYTDLEKLQETLFALVDGDLSQIVVDLSQVETMDSFGIGVLMSAYRRLSKKGGTLKLAGANDRVRSTLAITKVDTVVEVHSSLDMACASFDPEN